MIAAGKLRERLRIERNAAGVDSHGEPFDDWRLVETVWGEVRPLSMREQVYAQQVQSYLSHRVTLRFTDLVVKEILRPASNVNTLWSAYDYALISEAIEDPESETADGIASLFIDNNEEQIYGLTNPADSSWLTARRLQVKLHARFLAGTPSVDVRLKPTSSEWTPKKRIALTSSATWHTVNFRGGFTPTECTDMQLGLTSITSGASDVVAIYVAYVQILGIVKPSSLRLVDQNTGQVFLPSAFVDLDNRRSAIALDCVEVR